MASATLSSKPRGPVHWHQLTSPDVNSEDLSGLLASVFSSREEMKIVSHLPASEMVLFLDIIDNVMASPLLSTRMRKKCILALRKLCGSCGSLPSSHMIKEGLEKTGNHPITGGGFADVWRGTYNHQSVAIKAFRIYGNGDLVQVKKRFCKEAVIWKRLSHPNLLPYLGASTTLFQLCVVSVWMENGSISEYLKFHYESNRLALLIDIAHGLEYLHSMECVHGDLKGANILINSDFRACIADFGLMSIKSDPNTTNASTNATATLGSTRWMSPELLNPEDYGLTTTNPTLESDMYAFGMVIYEVFADVPPFHGMRDATVIHRVLSGVRPDRPQATDVLGLTDGLWELVQRSWRVKWQERPTVGVMLRALEDTLKEWVPPPPMPPEDFVHEEDIVDYPFSDSSSTDSDDMVSQEGNHSSGLLVDVVSNPQPSLITPTHIISPTSHVSEVSQELGSASQVSAMAVHGGHSLEPDEVVPELITNSCEEDYRPTVEAWLTNQQEYMLRRDGKRLLPGVVIAEEPMYMEPQTDDEYEM